MLDAGMKDAPMPQADYDVSLANDPAITRHFRDLHKEVLRERTGIPPIAPTVLLAPHVYKEDAALVAANIKNADVYVPELYGWEAQDIDTFQRVSAGQMTPQEAEPTTIMPFGQGIHGAIYNSHVPVMIVDAPVEEQHRFMYKDTDSETFFQPTWEETVTAVEENMRRFVWRENYMLNHLEPQLQQTMKDNPTLIETAKQRPLRVLFSIGTDHVSFARRLAAQQQSLNQPGPQIVQADPGLYEQSSFAQALAQFEKDGTVPEELAAHVILEKTAARLQTRPPEEMQKILKLLTPAEIKGMFERAVKLSHGNTGMTRAFMENELFGGEDEAGKQTIGLIDKKLAELQAKTS